MSAISKLAQKLRLGGTSKCVCPSCNHEVAHAKGTPCSSKKCPKCGKKMVGRGMPHGAGQGVVKKAALDCFSESFCEEAEKIGAGEYGQAMTAAKTRKKYLAMGGALDTQTAPATLGQKKVKQMETVRSGLPKSVRKGTSKMWKRLRTKWLGL